MATYTVTIVWTRTDTSTEWPWESPSRSGAFVDLDGVLVSRTSTISDDELTRTAVKVWSSKEEYIDLIINKNDDTFATLAGVVRTYMALNNFTSTVTEEDGTFKVFNSSNKTYEVQE